MRIFFFIFLCYLANQLAAQAPSWETTLGGERTAHITQLYEFQDKILMRTGAIAAEKYDTTGGIFGIDELSLISLDGELLLQKPIEAYGRYFTPSMEGVTIKDDEIYVYTFSDNDAEHPHTGYVDPYAFKLNAQLEVIDSIRMINYDISPAQSEKWFLGSYGSVWYNDTCYAINTYFVTDSTDLVAEMSAFTFGDTNAYFRNTNQDRRWVRRPTTLHYQPSNKTIVSSYDLRLFLFDREFNWLGDPVFYNSAPDEDREYFQFGASFPCAVETVGDYIYTGGPAGRPITTNINGDYWGAHIVQKYTSDLEFVDQQILLRDTVTWPGLGIYVQNYHSGWGENAMLYDGNGYLYTAGQIQTDRRIFVSKFDTNLNVVWNREWRYEGDESFWEVGNLLCHSQYDGIYLSVTHMDAINGQGSRGNIHIYRIGADGDLSNVFSPSGVSTESFINPNPASREGLLAKAWQRQVGAIVLHPTTGGKILELPITGPSLYLQDLPRGSYIATGLDASGRPIVRQKLILVE